MDAYLIFLYSLPVVTLVLGLTQAYISSKMSKEDLDECLKQRRPDLL